MLPARCLHIDRIAYHPPGHHFMRPFNFMGVIGHGGGHTLTQRCTLAETSANNMFFFMFCLKRIKVKDYPPDILIKTAQ